MTNEQGTPVTAEHLAALAAKLDAFGQTLPLGEREAFASMLTQAAKMRLAESEVSGYFTLIELKILPYLISAALGDGGAPSQLPAVQSTAF